MGQRAYLLARLGEEYSAEVLTTTLTLTHFLILKFIISKIVSSFGLVYYLLNLIKASILKSLGA